MNRGDVCYHTTSIQHKITSHSLNLLSTLDAKIYCNWCDGVSVLNEQLADGMEPTRFKVYVPPEGHGGIEPLVVNLI